MKKIICIFLLIASATLLSCQRNDPQTSSDDLPPEETKTGSAYDEALATRLNADKYGMKKYVMAFLKAGPVRSQDQETAAKLQRAHLDNIRRMAEAGQLVVAGPFLDDGAVRGIYIFNVETVEEARALTETDPSIQAGRLVMDLHPWYGPAALQLLNEWHPKIAKESI